jgi:hypothetical protein
LVAPAHRKIPEFQERTFKDPVNNETNCYPKIVKTLTCSFKSKKHFTHLLLNLHYTNCPWGKILWKSYVLKCYVHWIKIKVVAPLSKFVSWPSFHMTGSKQYELFIYSYCFASYSLSDSIWKLNISWNQIASG